MIPKTIHYCWFGHNPKPKLAEKCIKSWKKILPDYEIIEWNEDNFDVLSSPLYVRQAYEAKKWAFVTDYVRLWALTEYGGIYMDTDVQVLKSLDPFLHHQAFSGFEDESHIPTGIMAAEKGFPLFVDLLNYYNDAKFVKADGTYDLTTNVKTITEICIKKGLIQNNTLQTVEGFTLYPNEYFCPISYKTMKLKKTRNTVVIHWFAASWHSKEEKEKQKKRRRKNFWYGVFDYIIHIPNRIMLRILGHKKYEELKKKLKG